MTIIGQLDLILAEALGIVMVVLSVATARSGIESGGLLAAGLLIGAALVALPILAWTGVFG